MADNPDDSGLYTLYGSALGRSGDYDGALQALEQALELNPDNLEAEQTRAFVSQTQLLVEAVTDVPTGGAGTALREGLTALETGALDAAQTAFDRAAELAPGGLPSFYQGFIRQRRGDLRGAVEAYTASLASFPEPSPGQATVLNNAGFAYFRLGRYDRAVELLTEAVAADPESSEAQLNLGLIYYDLGRFEDALAPLEGRPPVGLLAFDCIARRGVLGDEGIRAEIDRIAVHADGAPVGGFYTYGEIARNSAVGGFHNQTLVVLAVG